MNYGFYQNSLIYIQDTEIRLDKALEEKATQFRDVNEDKFMTNRVKTTVKLLRYCILCNIGHATQNLAQTSRVRTIITMI